MNMNLTITTCLTNFCQKSLKGLHTNLCFVKLNWESLVLITPSYHFYRGGYAFGTVGLSDSKQDYTKPTKLIRMKLGGRVQHGLRKKPFNFEAALGHWTDPHI